MADSLPSHPFADLFALLSPDSIPKWTSLVELLRKLSDKEHQLGGEDETGGTQNWLEKLENARDLLRETEEQLVELYLDRHVDDLAEASAGLAIGDAHYTRISDQAAPPELALDRGAEGAGQQAGTSSEVVGSEGDAEVEICRRLMGAVDLTESGVIGQISEVDDLDEIEESCEMAEIHTVSHQAAGNSDDQAIEVRDLDIEDECENAPIQATNHHRDIDDGASIEASEVRALDVGEWGNADIPRDYACGQAGGVECEICERLLKCGMDGGMDWDEGARGHAAGEEDSDEDEGNYKDVEMS